MLAGAYLAMAIVSFGILLGVMLHGLRIIL